MSVKTREELNQAIKLINKETQFTDAHLELVADDSLDKMFQFIEEHFFPDEVLTQSLGMEVDKEVLEFWKQALTGNLSILLVSDTSQEIIACRGIAIGKRGQSMTIPKMNNTKHNTLLQFLLPEKEKDAIYDYFNVDTCVEFLFLGTHRKHRKQGLAKKMMQAALMFCQHLGLDPVCIEGGGTSNFSQKVYENHGFETIRTYIYGEYKIDGEIIFKNTGEHKSLKVYFKKLT